MATRYGPYDYIPAPGYRGPSPTTPLYNPDGSRYGVYSGVPAGMAGSVNKGLNLGQRQDELLGKTVSDNVARAAVPFAPRGGGPPQSSDYTELNADAVNRWYDEYASAYKAKYGIAPPHNRDLTMEGAIGFDNPNFRLVPSLYPQQPQTPRIPDKTALTSRWTAVNEPAGVANIDKQITDNARMAAYAQSQRAAQSINAVTNESTPPELKSTMDAIMARYASLGRYGTSEMYQELEAARRQYEMSQVSSIAGQYSYFNR